MKNEIIYNHEVRTKFKAYSVKKNWSLGFVYEIAFFEVISQDGQTMNFLFSIDESGKILTEPIKYISHTVIPKLFLDLNKYEMRLR